MTPHSLSKSVQVNIAEATFLTSYHNQQEFTWIDSRMDGSYTEEVTTFCLLNYELAISLQCLWGLGKDSNNGSIVTEMKA